MSGNGRRWQTCSRGAWGIPRHSRRALLSADLGARRRLMASMTPGATAEARLPRLAGAGEPAGSDLLPEFAGLRVWPQLPVACPGFMKTHYSRSTAATTTWLTTGPVALLAISGAPCHPARDPCYAVTPGHGPSADRCGGSLDASDV
jgi:hypothetical protein